MTIDYRKLIIIREERLKICDSCEHKKQTLIGPQCGVCKCILSGKVSLPTTTCPLNKWGKMNNI